MQSRVDLSLASITSSSEFDEHGAYAEARVKAIEIRDERVVGHPRCVHDVRRERVGRNRNLWRGRRFRVAWRPPRP